MIITGSNLSKSYGKLLALKNVSIECSVGEICGLLGVNGAGKSTLFKILLGVITPDTGEVIIKSQSVKPVGGIIERPALYEYLNSYDNLRIFGSIQGAKVDKISLQNNLIKVGLPIDRKDPVKNFSMGMKQRLGIAIALLNNPDCLILDEPFSGLDPMGIASLRKLILHLAHNEKLAIFISSHIIEEISKISDRLYVIKNGEIVNSGLSQKLIEENTSSYTIYANNILESETLKNYSFTEKGNYITIKISHKEVPLLINKLYHEKIFVTSCTPEINIDKLFEVPKS